MYNKLNEYLKRPALYERTTEQLWNDPYIATQMLKAHLDPNTDAASRKPDFIHRTAEWVASLLPDNAKLLDIGCGPGLYTKQSLCDEVASFGFTEYGFYCDATGKTFVDDSETMCVILKKG